jgi:hypothetical protein
LTEAAKTIMIIEYVIILGKNLFNKIPIKDPENIIGIETKAY